MAIWRRLRKHQKSGWDQPSSSRTADHAGFTLIELLVSIILGSLVLTPLFGLMINILQSDRREQAKYATEQDLRAAADYIAKDLEEAVYIYDQAGLADITNNYATAICPSSCDSSTGSSLPASPGKVPVLVFWKRSFAPDGILDTVTGGIEPDDTFVYSLVAYYLINDEDTDWSGASRISRFEVSGGILNPFDPADFFRNPDDGYKPFDLSLPGTLQENMNRWHKADDNYDKEPVVLVDYIYNYPDNLPPSESCPAEWTQVPNYANVDDKFKTNGFYACVKSAGTGANEIARVFLTGNALARLKDPNDISDPDERPIYKDSNASFFPQTRIEIRGNGGLG